MRSPSPERPPRPWSLRAGDVATLRLGDGSPLRATVAAVYDRGLGFADVLIAWDDAADHVSDPVVTTVLVRTAAGGAEEVSRFARSRSLSCGW